MDTHDPALHDKANSLYWESDASVNDIADALDLSKGALYGYIEPLDADMSCPVCGGAMEYANRTARDKGLVSCPGCEMEEDARLVEAAHLDALDEVPPAPDSAYVREGGVSVRTLVASTLLGLAAGLALGQVSRRK